MKCFRSASAILLAVLLLAIAPLSSAGPDALEIGTVEFQTGQILIETIKSESAYGKGIELGDLMGAAYQSTISLFRLQCLLQERDYDEMLEGAREHAAFLESNCPWMLERAQGISQSTGIQLDEIIAASIYGADIFKIHLGCTTAAEAYPATVDGAVYNHWNFDMSYFYKVVLHAPIMLIMSGNYSYVAYGIPGIITICMLNEKGLSSVASACEIQEWGDVSASGFTAYELNEMVLASCANVHEAELFLKSQERQSGGGNNLNMVLADALGGIMAVEYTHGSFAVCYGKEGVVSEANHHQFLDGAKTGAANRTWYESSWIRCDRMWQMQEEYRGTIDADTVMHKMMSDHTNGISIGGILEGGFNSICRHGEYDQYDKNVAGQNAVAWEPGIGGTNVAAMVEPKALTIWWCCGHPCRSPFIPLDFSLLLSGDFPQEQVEIDTNGLSNSTLENGAIHEIIVTNLGGYRQIALDFDLPDGVSVKIGDAKAVISEDINEDARANISGWTKIDGGIFTMPGGSSVKATIEIQSKEPVSGAAIKISAAGASGGSSDNIDAADGIYGASSSVPGFEILTLALSLVCILALSLRKRAVKK